MLKKYLLSILIIAFSLYAGYKSYYELFINEPRVHYSRVEIEKKDGDLFVVTFNADVPTITPFLSLLSALGLFSTSVGNLISNLKNKNSNLSRLFQYFFLTCVVVFHMIYFFNVISNINIGHG